jgi:hypothetical protein
VGWWTQNENGASFAHARAEEMLWGDGPADVMGDAIQRVVEEFTAGTGRPPTKSEVIAGLVFSLAVLDELPDGFAWPWTPGEG